MISDKKWLLAARQCCAEFGPEDGIPPQQLERPQNSGKREHKQLQLCKHVMRTVNLMFQDESLTPALRDLIVHRVELSSNGRQFLITVMINTTITGERKNNIANALVNARGYIRTIVAQAIERKRVPAIVFRIARSDNPMYYEVEV